MKRLVTQGLAKPIGEFASVEYGYMPMEDYADELAGEPLIRVTNIKNQLNIELDDIKYVNRSLEIPEEKRIRVGDVLLVQLGDTTGKVGYVGDPLDGMVFPSYCLRVRSPKLPGEFLAVFLDSELGQRQLWRLVTFATVRPNTSKPHVQSIIVPLPDDATLRDIKQAVTRATDLRQESRRLYAEAEALLLAELGLDDLDLSHQPTYTKSFGQAWAAGRLDAEYWGTGYTTLIDYLKSMPHYTLADLADFANGATPRGARYLERGIPFLRIQNVGRSRLELDDVVYIDEETHNDLLSRSQLQPGDVLITITGRIGTSAVVPEDMPIGNINQHIVRMRLRQQINPYYLAVFLNSEAGHLQTEREAYGTTREALPYYCLERIIVPEAPPALQERIEAKILCAEAFLRDAKHLLEEAKGRLEEMVLGET